MNKSYHAISGIPLAGQIKLLQPPTLPEIIHINDPASGTLFDFKYQQPPLISSSKSLSDLKKQMEVCHLPISLVADFHGNICGIITAEDLLGEKPIKISQEKRIQRHEIEIKMLMTPLDALKALHLNDIAHAKVGHIIQTLRETKQTTLLVIDEDSVTHEPLMRGFFSASLISKQLDQDITFVMSEAESVAELQHDMH